jgi:DNA-binding transcriptional LysR family regulator
VRSIAAASPEFWRKYGRPRHPRDLAALPCVRYSNIERPGSIKYWDPKGESGAFEPPIRLLANNGDFLIAMAADGAGFIVEPTFFLHSAARAHTLEIALAGFEWSNASLYVVYPPTRQVSARVRAFADAVIARFNNNPYWDEILRPA